ncbi:MAG TPA: hypothetical protein VKR42_13720 [Ktedonobacteraceae bacterium]|nr:hypothetical protein [Ktedonobacteraceae bacterium]
MKASSYVGKTIGVVIVEKGTVTAVKKAEKKRASLVANLGDLNRPLRVRPVRVMGREWWAVDSEDTWPGMVMDLRRLGFESMAWEDEVLVREGAPAYEPQMEGPAAPQGLKPFPLIHPTIQIRKESFSTSLADFSYLDTGDDEEDMEDEDEFEPEDLYNGE